MQFERNILTESVKMSAGDDTVSIFLLLTPFIVSRISFAMTENTTHVFHTAWCIIRIFERTRIQI